MICKVQTDSELCEQWTNTFYKKLGDSYNYSFEREDILQEFYLKMYYNKINNRNRTMCFGKLLNNLLDKYKQSTPVYNINNYNDLIDLDYENIIEQINNYYINGEPLEELLEQLIAKERKVILYRYYGNMTYQQIGDQLCLSRERIRQLELRSLRKIREYINKM